jgi:hypothetical protein
MQGETAGGTGQPGRHGDQVGANGRGGSAGVEGTGQATGSAGEVVRDGSQHRPRGLAPNDPQGRWANRAGGSVGDDLLDDRMITMEGLGLRHAGDEHGVIAPDIEQSVLPGSGLRVEAFDASHASTGPSPAQWQGEK